MQTLGELRKVNLRTHWSSEASDFTPWLADNLGALAAKIGFDIELIETESGVGNYRADILGKRMDNNELVVIENQFGNTDHNHLGQLLTYAAGVGADGVGAKSVIWIAEHFNEPHLAAIDWLNKCTEPGVRFFGIELELWQIGDSLPAPHFSVVSRPNNWQKVLTQTRPSLQQLIRNTGSFGNRLSIFVVQIQRLQKSLRSPSIGYQLFQFVQTLA